MNRLTGVATPAFSPNRTTAPVCSTSRSAFMTGRHAIRSGTGRVVWGVLYELVPQDLGPRGGDGQVDVLPCRQEGLHARISLCKARPSYPLVSRPRPCRPR